MSTIFPPNFTHETRSSKLSPSILQVIKLDVPKACKQARLQSHNVSFLCAYKQSLVANHIHTTSIQHYSHG